MLELFRRLHGEGQSILLVTHDREIAAAAERMVEMRDGRIVERLMRVQEEATTFVWEA